MDRISIKNKQKVITDNVKPGDLIFSSGDLGWGIYCEINLNELKTKSYNGKLEDVFKNCAPSVLPGQVMHCMIPFIISRPAYIHSSRDDFFSNVPIKNHVPSNMFEIVEREWKKEYL